LKRFLNLPAEEIGDEFKGKLEFPLGDNIPDESPVPARFLFEFERGDNNPAVPALDLDFSSGRFKLIPSNFNPKPPLNGVDSTLPNFSGTLLLLLLLFLLEIPSELRKLELLLLLLLLFSGMPLFVTYFKMRLIGSPLFVLSFCSSLCMYS
jgi:hypothetical protein